MKDVYNKLLDFIQNYKAENWTNSESITNEQVDEEETAEQLVEIEREYIL